MVPMHPPASTQQPGTATEQPYRAGGSSPQRVAPPVTPRTLSRLSTWNRLKGPVSTSKLTTGLRPSRGRARRGVSVARAQADGLGSTARRAQPPRGGEPTRGTARAVLRTKAGQLAPGSGSGNAIIGLMLGNAMDIKGVSGDERLTEAVEANATEVTPHLPNAGPRNSQGSNTASPAEGGVKGAVKDGIGLK